MKLFVRCHGDQLECTIALTNAAFALLMVLLPHKGDSNDIRHYCDGIVILIVGLLIVDINYQARVVGRTFAGTRVVAI